jgi:hypothetical protein
VHTKFKLGSLKARQHYEDPGVDEKSCVLKNRSLRLGLDVSRRGQGKVVVFCEYLS